MLRRVASQPADTSRRSARDSCAEHGVQGFGLFDLHGVSQN